jgi:hypothetical protein
LTFARKITLLTKIKGKIVVFFKKLVYFCISLEIIINNLKKKENEKDCKKFYGRHKQVLWS